MDRVKTGRTASKPRRDRTSRIVWALVVIVSLHTGVQATGTANPGRVVPSETCRGLWIVPVTFDGDSSRRLRLVLDTGAARASVDPDAIARVAGRRIRPGKKTRLKHGEAGPLKISDIKVVSHEMDHLSRALGMDIDGILGFQTFRDLLLTLDYPAGEIRVSKGVLPEADGRTVFEDVGKVRPYLALDVGGTRVAVLIDSGATGGLTLREKDPLEWETTPRATSGSVRYDFIQIDKNGRARDALTYGPLQIHRPVVEVVKNGTRLAGWEILRRFVWTFDQRNRRVRMIPDSDEPILMEPVRGPGLVFQPRQEGLEVVRVFAGMPAERAGVRAGDVVVAINGTPVYERGCRSMYGDRQANAAVLTLRRGDATQDLSIRLDVLVP